MFRSLKRSRDDSDDSHPLDFKKVCPWQDTSTPISTTLAIPEPPDTDQTLRFRAPTLTPIDSSDEEDNSRHALQTATVTKLSHSRPSPLHTSHPHPSKLLLSADDLSPWQQQPSNQPSPIPHALINHSLDISESALTAPAFGHDESDSAPRLSAAQPDTMMEDVPQKAHLPAIRLPSPVSDTDMAMTDSIPEPQTSVDVNDYLYRVPTPGLDYGTVSPIPVAAHPMSRHASRQNTPTPPCPIPHRRSALVMGYRADCDKCRCKVPGHYSHIVQRA